MAARSPVVLIVDDHEDSRAMYAFGLLAMGFQAEVAATGEDALARVGELHPDVIVADVSLPGMSGLDLTRRLRGDPSTRETGILVLTGHAGSAVMREANAAGCDRFLLKPCLPDALVCEIRDLLLHRQHDPPRV